MDVINKLILIISSNLPKLEDEENLQQLKKYFENTLKLVDDRKKLNPDLYDQ
jgi:hypothetical protein